MASSAKKSRKTYKHEEKIICGYCDSEMIFKNLKSHNELKHESKPLSYRLKCVKDIAEMMKDKQKTSDLIEVHNESDDKDRIPKKNICRQHQC